LKANGKREQFDVSLSSLSLEPGGGGQPLLQQPRQQQLAAASVVAAPTLQYAAAAYPQQQQPAHILLAPSHFQQPAELMQDPAIMSFR
jgi:hypothetical protein